MPTTQTKEVLTTGDVARLCHVAPRTVSKWFDTGKLRGYRIPGSRDRRIPLATLMAFMRAHGIPLNELDGGTCRVLVLAGSQPQAWVSAFRTDGRYETRSAGNGFEAGLIAQQFRPHVIVVDLAGVAAEDAQAICRNLKASPDLSTVKMICLSPEGDGRAWSADSGFDECLSAPFATADLLQAVQRVTNLIT